MNYLLFVYKTLYSLKTGGMLSTVTVLAAGCIPDLIPSFNLWKKQEIIPQVLETGCKPILFCMKKGKICKKMFEKVEKSIFTSFWVHAAPKSWSKNTTLIFAAQ